MESPELTLVLQDRKVVEGALVTAHGGLAGARIEAFPLSASRQLLETSVPAVRTGPSGRFRLEVPAGTTSVLLWAAPPGFGFTVVRRSLDDLRIRVAGAESRLRIPAVRRSAQGLVPVVMMNGLPTPAQLLVDWALTNGARLGVEDEAWSVPAVPSGV